MTDPSAVAALVRATDEAFGGVQVLVNNAALFGKISQKPFFEISSEEWDRVMAVNVRGPFECVKAVLPVMKRQRYGKIINIASGTVFKGTPMMLHYVTSKGARHRHDAGLGARTGRARHLRQRDRPGPHLERGGQGPERLRRDARPPTSRRRALKREEEPEDLVGTVVFLASHDSDFMTGQTMLVDGGSAMH